MGRIARLISDCNQTWRLKNVAHVSNSISSCLIDLAEYKFQTHFKAARLVELNFRLICWAEFRFQIQESRQLVGPNTDFKLAVRFVWAEHRSQTQPFKWFELETSGKFYTSSPTSPTSLPPHLPYLNTPGTNFASQHLQLDSITIYCDMICWIQWNTKQLFDDNTHVFIQCTCICVSE